MKVMRCQNWQQCGNTSCPHFGKHEFMEKSCSFPCPEMEGKIVNCVEIQVSKNDLHTVRRKSK